ncbi:hypothetical protein VKT23_019485 [Stygiomarasmius scandens]|uniref:Uncharacterized protein n=1 Tax=Marasmiellus scandens TaxID=2682957 RepID=A0ABR1ILA9_9AGAR
MQAPTGQPSSHTRESPSDSVHFFEGSNDALLFDVRCYATTASNGPIVVPVSAPRPEEAAAEFFRHGARKGEGTVRIWVYWGRITPFGSDTKFQKAAQTSPGHSKGPDDLQKSTTFFCDSTGVRLQGCSLYAITDCKAGFFEVPEKPSDSYLEALESNPFLRGPTSKAAKNDPNPMTVTHMGRMEYQSSCNLDFYGACIAYLSTVWLDQ